MFQTDPVKIYQRKWIVGGWMKRSEIRKALEAWFDVERYEAIEKLTLQQFYVEVE
ncbi:hypothetical protein BvCmsNSNP030_1241 [Escherichia coli]|nr:hypothetical protein BvCmsNSNP030_1241 [Escherichia coli]